MTDVSVLICTYRRPERLSDLLADLLGQTRAPDEIVVVDNDPAASARDTVRDFAATAPFAVHYDVQPVKNIALTRNRTVALARGRWLAMVDDDERVPSHWLQTHLEMAAACAADGVLGPVIPQIPPHAAAWIRRGRFFEYGGGVDGRPVPPSAMWVNNALLDAGMVKAEPGPFDARYGLTGGEDSDLMSRLAARGRRIIWSDQAYVTEPVEARRLNLRWILLRALSGGQDYATLWSQGRFGTLHAGSHVLFFLRSLLQMTAAAGLALMLLPAGRHHCVAWLRKAAANAGKISALFGWRYREYGAVAPVRSDADS